MQLFGVQVKTITVIIIQLGLYVKICCFAEVNGIMGLMGRMSLNIMSHICPCRHIIEYCRDLTLWLRMKIAVYKRSYLLYDQHNAANATIKNSS